MSSSEAFWSLVTESRQAALWLEEAALRFEIMPQVQGIDNIALIATLHERAAGLAAAVKSVKEAPHIRELAAVDPPKRLLDRP